jgi:eukaryotic-like serine/threonine-protein kinase
MVGSHRRDRASFRRGRRGIELAAAILVPVLFLGVLAGVGPASASSTTTAVPASAGPPNSAAYNWVELHGDNSLSGYASNSSLNISNVGSLGVRWAASMYGPALASPVVSDTSLGMMTYIGTDAGYVLAFKAGTAQLVWGRPLGGNIIASPVVSDGALWMATQNPAKLYKFNLTTGATECSLVTSHEFYSSFTAATPPGGKPSIYVSNLDNGYSSGPMMGIEASNCSVEWSFSDYHDPPNGPWSPIAYGVDKKGTPLVLDGTSDPDQSEYAVNALTGKLVWRFQGPGVGDYDIAAGATISAPGVNGFADGVAYVPTKFGEMFALNLTTGAKIWSYIFNPRPPLTTSATGRSTAALDGTNLVFGYHSGVIDLNAVNGKLRWNYKDPSSTEVLSSVAIVGKTKAAVICADLSGAVHALNIANGDSLYNYQTGGYIVSSPAVSDGDVIIASSDGLLYDFAVGGGNDTTLPTASITSPAYDSSVANPNGSEVISGTASDAVAVGSVDVSIESGGVGGTWWDGATGQWRTGPFDNPATLVTPGGTTTDWSYDLPVPASGGSYLVSVTAHSSEGQASTGSDQLEFSVQKATTGLLLEASQYDVAAGGKLTVIGSGFSDGESVAISLRGVKLTSTQADETGGFTDSVTLPEYADFGLTSLLATGGTSHSEAAAPIYITNSWDNPGGNQGHSGYESDDASYSNIFFVGQGDVRPAWDSIIGSAITTSAAVAGGVAYVGDAAGQLLAIDAHNGSVLWTWQDPSGKAIDGAPTIDPTNGLVMISTADGTVTALTTAGTLDWSATVGGVPNAPTFGAGEVYVSSSDGSDGSVTALVESSGATTWSKTLSSPVTSASTIDTTSGLVMVGESSGVVTALSTSSGSTVWSFTAGGAVSTSPMEIGGSVYVGSANGTVYSLSEATGDQHWSHSIGSPITASPAYYPANGLIFVGTSNGSLTALKATSGAVSSTLHYGSPVMGIATVLKAVFITCANGKFDAARTYGQTGEGFDTSAPITTAPVVVDGAVYVGNSNGNLYAVTPYGAPPL